MCHKKSIKRNYLSTTVAKEKRQQQQRKKRKLWDSFMETVFLLLPFFRQVRSLSLSLSPIILLIFFYDFLFSLTRSTLTHTDRTQHISSFSYHRRNSSCFFINKGLEKFFFCNLNFIYYFFFGCKIHPIVSCRLCYSFRRINYYLYTKKQVKKGRKIMFFLYYFTRDENKNSQENKNSNFFIFSFFPPSTTTECGALNVAFFFLFNEIHSYDDDTRLHTTHSAARERENQNGWLAVRWW